MNIGRAQRMIRDAHRGQGKYTLADYIWLVNNLVMLLDCRALILAADAEKQVTEPDWPIDDDAEMESRRCETPR